MLKNMISQLALKGYGADACHAGARRPRPRRSEMTQQDAPVLTDDDVLLVYPQQRYPAGYMGPGNCVKLVGPKLGNVAVCDLPWRGPRPTQTTPMPWNEIKAHLLEEKYQRWVEDSARSAGGNVFNNNNWWQD